MRAARCTSSKAAPVLDSVFTGLELVRTGLAVSKKEADYDGAPISRTADVAFGAAFSALFLSSAIYGFVKTNQCSKLRQRPYASAPMDEQRIWAAPEMSLDPRRSQAQSQVGSAPVLSW
jgi:hypothetical protein